MNKELTMNKDMCILYVEDEPMSRRVMSLMLVNEMEFTNLVMFEDSTDFEERLLALDPAPELIMLDIHMQPHTGFEMLEMLREHEQFRELPIIALTASVMNEEVQKLKNAGFDGCISKPINMDEFPQMLKAVVQGQKLWRITI